MRNDLRGADRRVTSRSMAVRNQHNGVAQGQSTARCSVNAELSMHAADYDLGDAKSVKRLLKISAQEGVRCGLPNPQVGWLNVKPVRELPGGSAVFEVAGGGFVLDEDHRCACRTRLPSNGVDTGYCSGAIKRRSFTSQRPC
jgi:hypothetical protein